VSNFDLGEARRRRGLEPKTLVITGADGAVEAKYDLVSELPATFFDAGAQGRFVPAFRALFVDQGDADDFLDRYQPSINDLGDILADLFPGIGNSLGEALASGRRSTNSGNR
jgi:hypothetical protein